MAPLRYILYLLPLCSLWLGVSEVGAQQVATPTFTADGGYYNLEQSVRIDCATSGAAINYTTNGIDPTSSDRSVAPGGTVLVDHAATLKARATKTGLSPSAVKSAAYNIIGKMAAGQNHSLSVKTDGTVWAWGNNANGQLARGSTSTSPLPVAGKVKTNSTTYLLNVATAAGGASHSAAAKTDGTVWAWGSNVSGQVGDGTTTQRLYAVQVKLTGGAALTGITDVVAGADHCLALKTGGTVWTWGLNSSGQVGIGNTTTPQKNAVQVKINSTTFLTGIVAIAAGGTHSLALKSDGTVWTWGLNSSGQLGNGNTTNQSYAVQVKVVGGTALTGVADVAAGANHSLARKTDGTLWAWGSNANGQLADGTTNPVSTSKQVNAVQVKASSTTFLTAVNGIAGGASHSLALKTDGTLWSWGLNSSNQLGDGTATQRVFPVQAKDSSGGFITGVVDFFAGASHGLVTRSNGTAWGWGLNSLGQAGSMTTGVNPNVALQILAGSIPMFIVISLDDPDHDSLLTWAERELGTNANAADTDGDSIPDGYEVSHNLNPLVNDAYEDPDHDYFLNGQEYAAGTNPQNPDTDTDGALDGEDVYPLDLHFALKKMPLSTYAVVEAVSGGGDRVKLNNLGSILYSQSYVSRGGASIGLGPGITAMGMNDSGQIAGYIGGTSSRAVMGTGPGSFRILDDLGGAARAINNMGVVVGWATFPGDYSAAARLDMGPPPSLLGAALTPTAMNDVGDVVGEVVQYYSAAIWTGGTTTPLSGFTYPYAINKDKYVAGTNWGTNFGQDHWIPLAWHDGETKYLPCQSNTMRSEAFSINKDGLMVGYTYTLAADYIPMLWQNAQYYNMNDLLDADAQAAGWTISMLWAINDHGVIVASAWRSGFGGLVLLIPGGGRIMPDNNQRGTTGDLVMSTLGPSGLQHYVSPKESGGFVVLKAVGPDSSSFSTNYAWEGDGQAVSGSPEKRQVSRAAPGKYQVRLRNLNTNTIVDTMNVWIVWMAITSTDVPIQEHFSTYPFTILDGGYDFAADILPPSILVTSSDVPRLDGMNFSSPPGGNHLDGRPLSGGSSLKWDISRQTRQRKTVPSGWSDLSFLPPPSIYQDVNDYPLNPVEGNDDAGTSDEDNDPYHAPDQDKLISHDMVTSGVSNLAGSPGDVITLNIQFREFTRLEMGGAWYPVSDFYPWRFKQQFKKLLTSESSVGQDLNGDGDTLDSVEVWRDDSSVKETNNNDW